MVQTLYTFGYLRSNTERIMKELLALQTPLIDIRYSPTSKNWKYAQAALQSRLDYQYYWIKELGNEHYKEALNGKFSEDTIKIHNVKIGLSKLQTILEQHRRAAIFCACADRNKCHRSIVTKLAETYLNVKIVHL